MESEEQLIKPRRKMKNRMPIEIRNRAAEMFSSNPPESVHQVSKRLGVSKPWATKFRDNLDNEMKALRG